MDAVTDLFQVLTVVCVQARGALSGGTMDTRQVPRTARPSHLAASPAEIAGVTALLARVGLVRAQQILGLDRHTLDRVRGGLPVHRGTLMCVRAGLAQPTPPERAP